MAALRMVFQSWIDGEPEEPPEDGPTEDQLQEYEQAARDHQSMVSGTLGRIPIL